MKKTAERSGIELKTFIAKAMGISNNKAKAVIDSKVVFVNDRRTWMASHVLERGDIVEIKADIETVTSPVKVLNILFENNELIAVDKPAGIVSNDERGSAEDILRKQTKNNSLQAAHRLDKQTSGVMLFVKSAAVFEKYKKIWKERGVKKTYMAVGAGEAGFDEREINSRIDGREAVTRLYKLSTGSGLTLFKVEIDTGRKHQIRIHMAEAGYPVAGDNEYGSMTVTNSVLKKAARHMLHAYELSFPSGDKDITVNSPMPPDFLEFAELAGYKDKSGK